MNPEAPEPDETALAERCSSCGNPVSGEHERCAYDPPRFCPGCGRRLRVQVFPDGYQARCLVCDDPYIKPLKGS